VSVVSSFTLSSYYTSSWVCNPELISIFQYKFIFFTYRHIDNEAGSNITWRLGKLVFNKTIFEDGWFSLFMVFYATFNNISVISWRSVLLVEETGVPGENHRPVASHWQTFSHNVLSSTPLYEQDSKLVIDNDDIG